MALTPMMQQYLEVKEKCKDCVLFFRLGDFYEMFFQDAEIISKELELVLTGRDCGLAERAPMCGIPYHAANNYIGRLINKGYKVAICEQLEDPSLAKGIVKRDIIKVVTPGTYMDSNFLEDTKNIYIMSIYIDINDIMGICFADISTGEFYCTDVKYNENIVFDEISKYGPKEIIVSQILDNKIVSKIKERFDCLISIRDEDFFTLDALKNVEKQFSNINTINYSESLINASNGILNYVMETQKLSLSNLNKIEYYNVIDYLSIDINSKRNLELTETLREKTKKGSLLWVLDKTNTAMGARTLRKWLEQPLINKNSIEKRINAIESLLNNLSLHEDLKEALKQIYDIERIVGKISAKSVNAKELVSLKNSISKLPNVKDILSNFNEGLLGEAYINLDLLTDIHTLLDESIADNPSMTLKEGNIIKDGYNSTIDELRSAKAHGKEWIASLENSERELTGIKSLKVGYNKVFGYYIEVTNSNLSSIPEGRYIRKQTLSNAERYITPELKEMEDKILGSEEKLISFEYELFTAIRDNIEKHIDRMKNTALLISQLDCISSLTTVALENNYCKPQINDTNTICIEEGRHPVIEKIIPIGTFVSNNTTIDTNEDQMLIITGPNMAGKSTYMRQVALISIMTQLGSFVPARKANMSICDKIFTRIGASDDLSAGKSTFMVEMWEVSNILNNVSKNSLVLLDEVGRGTSTYDGLSIAWAVIEYICNTPNIRCKTLFATHYHELTKLEGMIQGIKNYSVAVKEVGSDIAFLHKIIKGGADQSYGIEVAKLAGIPDKVIIRAKEILSGLEKANSNGEEVYELLEDTNNKNSINKNKKSKVKHTNTNEEIIQMDFTDLGKENLLKELSNIDILNLTPMDGFNKLFELVKKAKAL